MASTETDDVDVVIVGAGPAGLSAALVLGRACRRVLVFDHGRPRNARSRALHGFLTRDGIPPPDLLRIAREQLRPYDTVRLVDVEVVDAVRREDGGFLVTLDDGRRHAARKLLIATGVADHVPALSGIDELYGRSVFHCPYCDGWELRGQPLAVYGRGARARGLALELTGWTRDIVVCTDGPGELDAAALDDLARNGIRVIETPVRALEGRDGRLERVVFDDGSSLARRALFFTAGQTQCSDLASRLGCEFNEKGTVRTQPYETTSVPGLYVAGDASRMVQWAVVAAAEGAEAAYSINQALIQEQLR
jgi:thioredoxin reductase